MLSAREVFDNPQKHLNFIISASDAKFEGQFFDRKEAGNTISTGEITPSSFEGLKDHVVKTISAFANINREGSLLIIGVSKIGEILGTSHLKEKQLNALTAFNTLLRNQTATCKTYDCKNRNGDDDKIILIYVPFSESGICETLDSQPKAWYRSGSQSLPLNELLREQLKRDKGIVNFERTQCCEFDMKDVDTNVLNEFKRGFMEFSTYDITDVDILINAGALDRKDTKLYFNNAGYLFFAINPQRILTHSYIRLLRFDSSHEKQENRGINNFDKSFDGNLPQQIRKMRAFFRESGFFKIYSRRNPQGGFIDEPEFPQIAIDEAIINALAHRDYGINLPIECTHYTDAFLVENPGKIIQREKDLPEEFSLINTTLNSLPRNPKLVEWLKLMKDDRGTAFVRMIAEGTKRMRDEMVRIGLPAPAYKNVISRTIVTLFNNSVEREAKIKEDYSGTESTQHSNLFKLDLKSMDGEKIGAGEVRFRKKDILLKLIDNLKFKGWYIDSYYYSKIICHKHGAFIKINNSDVQKIIQFFPAYSIQFREYWNSFYLSIDYTLMVKNIKNIRYLLNNFTFEELDIKRGVCQFNGWRTCNIVSATVETTRVFLYDFNKEENIDSSLVIPDLSINKIEKVFEDEGITFNLSSEIKRLSLSSEKNSARLRDEKTKTTAEQLSKEIFPMSFENLRILMSNVPQTMSKIQNHESFYLDYLAEPVVEFHGHKETTNIRDGITSYGSYDYGQKTIELVPICIDETREQMARLIERIKFGKYKYSGSERTFSTKFIYNAITTVRNIDDILKECGRLLSEHKDWEKNINLNRIFIIHIPEKGFSLNDEHSPYYQIKWFLFERGIPCQMIDTPTLENPDWKDLNLALNIIAKCGVTPWVLPDKIPDADFFIGLSYTQSNIKGLRRLLGYATVFNEFGRWEFYEGSTEAFSYDDRKKYFPMLVEQTLHRLDLSESPNIYFHYSAKFSKEDRKEILAAAKKIRPKGSYYFVSINVSHNIRLYDSQVFTDGSLSRGSYIVTSPNQILLSTTGYNIYRKSLGTPKPLEVSIWKEKLEDSINMEYDLRALAKQVLCLTKLNWASTDSFCGEPITTKYAGDIAYLTDAFLRLKGSFSLDPVLKTTPWFI